MITSPHNEKLKLVRKLRDRKHREREGLFVTEGEDLLAAGRAAGATPRFALVAPGSGLEGEETAPELLDAAAQLGSGTRAIAVWERAWAERPAAPCFFLDAVSDPGNVGTIVRAASALAAAGVVCGAASADPFGPRAVRASMGAIFAAAPARAAIEETPAPRVGLVSSGGEGVAAIDGAATICLGSEREGLAAATRAACQRLVTIPLVPGRAESLNVASAAAIAAFRLSSPAMKETAPDA